VILCCLLNLIALGSPQTINSIFGITAPALDCSYMAVVALRLYYADHKKSKVIRKGPFTLGRYQKPINYIALVWTVFVTVVLFFPTANPVTALNMNYAVVVAGAIGIFAMSWWWLGARKTYVGPRVDEYPNEVYEITNEISDKQM
jgi:amino acid transporter